MTGGWPLPAEGRQSRPLPRSLRCHGHSALSRCCLSESEPTHRRGERRVGAASHSKPILSTRPIYTLLTPGSSQIYRAFNEAAPKEYFQSGVDRNLNYPSPRHLR